LSVLNNNSVKIIGKNERKTKRRGKKDERDFLRNRPLNSSTGCNTLLKVGL
jgi:hypothetical protein